MALGSTMAPLGAAMPVFSLPDAVTGALVAPPPPGEAAGTLVMFVCNHCPYVVHVRPVLVPLCHELVDRGLRVLAINSNSERTHPQDGPLHMKRLATEEGFRFPFLFDETQAVARAFDAACTPDFFLYDRQARLAWRGRMDGSRPGSGTTPDGAELRAACEAVLAGRAPEGPQLPSLGCGIKWHPT